MKTATIISYTTSTIPSITNLQEFIAYVARVSNPTNQLNTETSGKLISYLIKHKHWSPFEMANICIEINTTRDIARQILRHRSFSFQELSQRYCDPLEHLEFAVRECRLQDTKNRQNSIEVLPEDGDQGSNLEREWMYKQRKVLSCVESVYRWAINNGIAKEQARVVLPEGLTPSRLYMNGSVRSWIHYLQIRTNKDTQKEHREVALACLEEIKYLLPQIEEFIQRQP